VRRWTTPSPSLITPPVIDTESIAADSILEVGETQVWSCTSVPVTQAEVDAGQVDNTATLTGTPANGTLDPLTDAVSIPINPLPSFSLVKATTSTVGEAGDMLDYTFTVVNDGNVTIDPVAVTDPKCATPPVIDSESVTVDSILQVGETQIWSCISVPVTQAEADAGQVDNTATLTGTPAGGTLDAVTDDLSTPILAVPSFTLAKATASVPSAAGDTLDYTFTVVNDGNVTIDPVAVTDPKCATPPVIDTESDTTDAILEVGETQVWSCTSIPVTQAEADAGQVDNTATLTGTPAGGTLDPVTDDVSTPLAPAPSFSLVKATTTVVGGAGDTLDYTFTVVNDGNVTIDPVAVTDPKCATPPVIDSESITVDSILQVGETQVWSCTSIPVTQAEADAGQVDNTATLTGTPAGGTLDPVIDDLSTPIVAAPSFGLVKATTSAPTGAGDMLDYTFTVVNDGNVTIDPIAVTDPKCATAPVIDSESVTVDGILQVGETQIWSCTSVPVTQAEADAGQVDNTATLTGTPAGGTLDPVTDDLSTPLLPAPSFTLAKATSSVPTQAGDTLDYVFTVVNDGNVTIDPVTVVDAKCVAPPVIDSESTTVDGILQVGETQVWSCTSIPVTQAEVDAATVDNTAILTGTPANGTLDPVIDDVSTPITAAPAFSLVKATTSIVGDAGDTLDYTFTVVNNGNVTIDPVAVTDPKCATPPVIDSESTTVDGILQVAETQIWSCTSIPVTQAEVDASRVDNTATLTGTPAGGTLAPVDDMLSTPIAAFPSFTLAKATSSAPTAAGETLDYTFTVINDGNVTIDPAVVTDPKCATPPTIDSESITTDSVLEVGETQLWSCTSIPVTQAEADAGQVDNTATLTGTPAGGSLDPQTDTVSAPLAATPSFTLAKAAVSAPSAAGDTIDYTFTVVNDGNVTIDPVAVTDPKCATPPVIDTESITTDSALEVGETQVWSCTSIPVTQAEVDASQVNNIATVTGTPANGTLEPVTDLVSTPITPDPSFELTKATASAPTAAGETLDYTFTVVNNGNVSIDPVAIADPKCATPPAIDSETITTDGALEVGETQLWSCTSIPVTQAEVDAGKVDNSATLTGTPAGGTLDPLTDDLSTLIPPLPSFTLVKATASVPTAAGDTLDYTFTVVNDGNVTIDPVAVTDPKCAISPVIDSESVTVDAALEVGEIQVWSCTSIPVTQAEADAGQVDNTATLAGTPAGGTLAPLTDDVSTPINTIASIELIKAIADVVDTTGDGRIGAGDTVFYSFAVTNTGSVTLSNVTITDNLVQVAGGPITLAPGDTDTTTFTASYVITQADVDTGFVDNTAIVSGDTPGGTPVQDVSDSADPNHTGSVDSNGDPAVGPDGTPIEDGDPTDDPTRVLLPSEPAISLEKSATTVDVDGDGVLAAGDEIHYSFAVTNTGVSMLSNIVVTDNLVNVVGGPIASLAPGQTDATTFTAVYVITQTDVDTGLVENSATTQASDPSGVLVSDVSDDPTDSTQVDPNGDGNPDDPTVTSLGTPEPAIELIKSAIVAPERAGDEVVFEFVVTNIGVVTVADVSVDDPFLGGVVCDSTTTPGLASLAPGASATCTAPYVVTQADVVAGGIVNTAIASGVGSAGATASDVSDSGSATVEGNDGLGPDDPTFVPLVRRGAPVTRPTSPAPPPAAATAPAPAPVPTPTPVPPPPFPLALTGRDSTSLALVGSAILGAGVMLVGASRWRRREYGQQNIETPIH